MAHKPEDSGVMSISFEFGELELATDEALGRVEPEVE
jgi:hypothetical protein